MNCDAGIPLAEAKRSIAQCAPPQAATGEAGISTTDTDEQGGKKRRQEDAPNAQQRYRRGHAERIASQRAQWQKNSPYVHSGRFMCPWCAGSPQPEGITTVQGLMTHVTTRHEGAELGEEEAHFFAHLGRGTCRGCGYLCMITSKACGHCKTSKVPRRVRVGDVIQ